jgi:hypothetical protein
MARIESPQADKGAAFAERMSGMADPGGIEEMIERAAIASGYDPRPGVRLGIATNAFRNAKRVGFYEEALNALNPGETIERIAVGERAGQSVLMVIAATPLRMLVVENVQNSVGIRTGFRVDSIPWSAIRTIGRRGGAITGGLDFGIVPGGLNLTKVLHAAAEAFEAYGRSQILSAAAQVGTTDASAAKGSPQAAHPNSVSTELERLAQLHADGVLDAEEFRLAKRRVLERE